MANLERVTPISLERYHAESENRIGADTLAMQECETPLQLNILAQRGRAAIAVTAPVRLETTIDLDPQREEVTTEFRIIDDEFNPTDIVLRGIIEARNKLWTPTESVVYRGLPLHEGYVKDFWGNAFTSLLESMAVGIDR